MASTCFERYLLILRSRYTSGTWYIACVLCQLAAPELVQPTDITRTQYTNCRLCNDSWGWVSKARNMLRPLIFNKLNRKCIMLVSLYWYTMMHRQQSIKRICEFGVCLAGLALVVTIQKFTSNVQSFPRQSPDIYWHAELCSRRPCSV
jgi:hypothetical protein